MLTSVPLRLGESVQTRPVLTHRSGSFCVSSRSRAVVCSGSAGTSRADKGAPGAAEQRSSRTRRPDPGRSDVSGPLPGGRRREVGRRLSSTLANRVALVRSTAACCPRSREVPPAVCPGSRGVAATVPSQGSCRGRRTGEGQCCGIGLLVADWPVGVCGGLSPGLVR